MSDSGTIGTTIEVPAVRVILADDIVNCGTAGGPTQPSATCASTAAFIGVQFTALARSPTSSDIHRRRGDRAGGGVPGMPPPNRARTGRSRGKRNGILLRLR